jgi:hypothetical protein
MSAAARKRISLMMKKALGEMEKGEALSLV